MASVIGLVVGALFKAAPTPSSAFFSAPATTALALLREAAGPVAGAEAGVVSGVDGDVVGVADGAVAGDAGGVAGVSSLLHPARTRPPNASENSTYDLDIAAPFLSVTFEPAQPIHPIGGIPERI